MLLHTDKLSLQYRKRDADCIPDSDSVFSSWNMKTTLQTAKKLKIRRASGIQELCYYNHRTILIADAPGNRIAAQTAFPH